MYLTRLELQGFKSFADKTVIEFGKNITSIVGPNGSGKSNIADAIRWVLGEQSIKNLRGSKFEDIIFSGTSQRKSMGFAEVNLILDNTQKLIDLDFSEITVSRRLFRNGNSEYFINMVPCRLKDIHEMFYDTGVGRKGYSVVSQGKIDEILSSKSEDRREVFEEASGITKYKVRKQEAERKLEVTEQNLLRIKDIINELELQLEPLSIQADKARKYLDLREDLKQKEISLFVHNISRLNERYKKIDENINEKEEYIQAKKTELAGLNEREKFKYNAIRDLDDKIKNATDQFHIQKNEIERIKSEISLIDTKNSNSDENVKRFSDDLEKLRNDKAVIDSEKKKKNERIAYLQKQLEQFNSKLDEYQAQYNALIKNLGDDEAQFDIKKDQLIDKMDMMSDKKNQSSSIRSYLASVDKRRAEIKSEIMALLSQRDLTNSQISESKKNLESIDTKIAACVAKNTGAKSNLDSKKRLINENEAQLTKLMNEINFMSSKLRALKEMEENYEGYTRSVKEILQRCDRDPEFKKGIKGPLARLIDVDPEFAIPVDIALGQAVQNIVTQDEAAAKKAIYFLKKNQLGRATFLPVTAIRSALIPERIKQTLKTMPGFMSIASETVKYDDEYKDIVEYLLGRTIIAADLDSAVIISKKLKNEYRIVTQDGDIINRSGAITGGSIKGTTSNLLQRGFEIDELKSRINANSNQHEEAKSSNDELKTAAGQIEAEIAAGEKEINELRINYVKEQGTLKQVLDKCEQMTLRIEMLESESLQLDKDRAQNENELGAYQKQIDEIEKDIDESKKVIEQHNSRQKARLSEKDLLHQDITDHKISVNSVTESISYLNENIQELGKDDQSLDEEIKKLNHSIEHSRRTIEENTQKKTQLMLELKSADQHLIGKETMIDRLLADKENLNTSMEDAVTEKENLELEIENGKDDKSKLEIRKIKCEAEIDTIKNRLWDEYELTLSNCERTAMPVDNAQRMASDIDEIRTSVKELGDVNVNAIEDYVKTKERYEFLKIQHTDMVKAGEDLRKVIREMEVIMKKQFLEQFRKINEIFNSVFKDLFLGGTASIELVDESNVLESAIEINVQPPGKKLQNMMLLSGGEKAFTAIALLFAIIKLKDTPFCVLDEIDAALDDPNVVRFSDYVRDLTKRTQFILVTHRKGTMEASDVLYGVTAEEKGVSKIVSLDMNT